MSNSTEIHSQISLLLPWYANNTLEDEERCLVGRHVDECPECVDDLALLRSVDSAVNKSSPAPIVLQARVADFLTGIDEASAERKHLRSMPNLAIAATLLIAAVTVALIVTNQSKTAAPATRFHTATSTTAQISMDYVLLVPVVRLPCRQS